ncbi:MAG: 30S ribosomal protein S6 [Oligoflexia bacterium]|nr:30S ribosomal protein S6 [Oligoflexia bacterium]MBF0366022.1 30S ribosomal protein S6 [Oligoflexia bacterium]
MIYETAVLAQADTNDEKLASIKGIVTSVVAESNGEILIDDDWGVRTLAQPTEKRAKRGRYLYFMYRSNNKANAEIERKMRINENVIRSMIVQLGDEHQQENLVKNYKCPLQKNS